MSQTSSEPATQRVCAECGTTLAHHANRCWLCGRSAALAHLPRANAPWRFSDPFRFQLHSLFLTTALLSVCLAVARHWPALAMALVVPMATAYLRTMQIALEFGAARKPLQIGAKILLYLRSLAMALIILVGAAATLIVTIGLGVGCGILAGQWLAEPLYTIIGFVAGTSLGVFGSLAVAAWAGARLWPGPRPGQTPSMDTSGTSAD